MLAQLTIRAADLEASARFYDTVLPVLGLERAAGRGLHIGFAAASQADVDAFWTAGTDAGYADDGAPGPRPQYGDDYYGGFLLDPDGNSAGVRR